MKTELSVASARAGKLVSFGILALIVVGVDDNT